MYFLFVLQMVGSYFCKRKIFIFLCKVW
uniref:Uncharacterized protein n=1 Tax=Anguilla anguilla TaxID=7936 RepID=A0A0E9P878_ANGAN